MSETFLNGRVTLHAGDSRDVLKTLADCSIDSIVTDPPYALVSIVKRFGKEGAAKVKVPEGGSGAYARASSGFMGKQWDTGETAFAVEFWAECLRVLKPGGHVVAFSGTRTYHRVACAIEDAGFEVRDMLSWLYGSGFPKSHNVALGIDKASGQPARGKAFNMKGRGPRAEELDANGREFLPTYQAATEPAADWQGWGTALKPSCEPICFGRKPLIGTVASNVLQFGTGAINISACRVGTEGGTRAVGKGKDSAGVYGNGLNSTPSEPIDATRWPANLIHDGSDEVVSAFPSVHGAGAQREEPGGGTYDGSTGIGFGDMGVGRKGFRIGDSGSAARFFYTAKADSFDRAGSKHPTVKPLDLMQWLVRLVTPKGGLVLDPFAGTGTTGEAAFREGMRAVLIEREEEYQADIRRRMALCMAGPDERKRESIKAKVGDLPFETGSLFA